MFKPVFMPVLAPLLATRRLAGILFIMGVFQAGLTITGFGGWPCPIQSALSLPCPGCGLSRGVISLISGKWQAAIQYHPFSPVVLGALLMMGVFSLLPENSHKLAVHKIAGIEKRTGISFGIIIGMFAIWALRIVACISSRMDYQSLTMNTIGR